MDRLLMGSSLLTEFLELYPFQPATALWRAIEIGAVLDQDFRTGRVLDLGCGDGKLTEILIGHLKPGKRTWIGIDLDAAELELAKERKIYQTVHCSTSAKIPEEAGSFDLVFSNSVLEHISEIERTLDEVARVLKTGGEFLFTVPSDGFHTCLKGPLLPWVKKDEYLKDVDRRLAHLRYWSASEWTSQLQARGLKVQLVYPYLNEKEVARWELLSRMTGGLLYSLFRKNKAPIQIQRKLNLRDSNRRMPTPLAKLLAQTVGPTPSPGVNFGAVLISAIKQPAN